MDADPILERSKPKRVNAWPLVAMLFFSTVAGFGGGWVASQSNDNVLQGNDNQVNQRIVSSESQLIADVAEQVGPSVVSINVATSTPAGFGRLAQQESAGTGIIMSEDGLIVTNKHVVAEGATSISAKMI